jgi:hypothetical protein
MTLLFLYLMLKSSALVLLGALSLMPSRVLFLAFGATPSRAKIDTNDHFLQGSHEISDDQTLGRLHRHEKQGKNVATYPHLGNEPKLS